MINDFIKKHEYSIDLSDIDLGPTQSIFESESNKHNASVKIPQKIDSNQITNVDLDNSFYLHIILKDSSHLPICLFLSALALHDFYKHHSQLFLNLR